MPAYIIARVNVTDMAQYQNYTKLTPDIIARHGGKFIVRGGNLETLEGEDETRRVVVLEFPDYAAAKAFYTSEAYQAAIAVRKDAAEGQFIVIEGV